jgi:enterochelin esterase-like enzyme
MGIPFLTRYVTTLLFVITVVSIRGQMSSPQITQPGGPAVMHDTDIYRIKSRRVGAEFEIRVARPLPPFTGGTPSNYDVLYVLDGDLFFGVATDMTRLMHRLFGELPPILVVGIGYGTVDGGVINDRRNRDFTPAADERTALFGGASHFLDFLRDELKPLIAERYPQATGPSTLFGSSMGGLFASFAALERPESFERTSSRARRSGGTIACLSARQVNVRYRAARAPLECSWPSVLWRKAPVFHRSMASGW